MLSANQILDIKTQAFIGEPSSLENICKVYPLTIKEIVSLGVSKYLGMVGLLLLSENDIANIVKEKTGKDIPVETIIPLHYLLESAAVDNMFLLELQDIFSTFLKEEVLLLPKINSVLIGSPEEKRLITKDNFPILQDIIRIQNKRTVPTAPPENETPGQRKMRLLREKVAEVKRKQNQNKGEGQTLLDLLEIASTFGIDVKNCTLFAFYGLINRHQMREKWSQDLKMIAAGADPKKLKTKYWGEPASEEGG